ncbi:hypothetical protein MVLG_02890 [Microbotryum lychnidis-dioicae p1A1 Lamole]|uniref:Putative peptidase domain-containing protein n=1 Tax=Microbotryum lychnidis-dioicae (strain p1A1 Lamole / MvSl-1064) TaxID=683840 RepID=U5H6J0_USTV1|nr:hypothetical protein MVLG_02890 [Microbotryum lychnidis-dioicae p1A1 Lamole]|eukprot:KDE06854.1 hypothetical protein MVLG_02890 [Microbotryum lychnidis-dioicae p1A1 Lamole]
MRLSFLLSSVLLSLGVSGAPARSASPAPPPAFFKRHAHHSTSDKHSSQNTSTSTSFTTEVTILESCSVAQTHHLRQGLEEMLELANHAKERLLERGETDELYVTYFGNAPASSVIGYYSQIALGNKAGVILRCDDPDKNCATQSTAEGPWAGHYRGKNASHETVICPPSFNVSNRVSLSELCWDGRLIGSGNPSHYLGADLMHRLTHVPSVTFGHVDHTAEGYAESLRLASTNNSLAAFNSDTFQFFALDAYARDVAFAPNGCTVSMEQAKAEEAAAGGHSH